MWYRVADLIIRFRVPLLIIMLAFTAFMGYKATQVQLSFDYTNAIPTDNPKYKDYMTFKNTFGEDASNMMIGIQENDLFRPDFLNDYLKLSASLSKAPYVEQVLGLPTAVSVVRDAAGKMGVQRIFPDTVTAQNIDSLRDRFLSMPFYQGLLYNPEAKTYLMAVRINKDVLNSIKRVEVIAHIIALADSFGAAHQVEMHYSGLPLIRTQMATKVNHELKLFLILSFAFTAVILLLFFRSLSAVLISMVVVAIGVVWSFGTIALLGYKITLLTGVIPPLIVVIGIPNCIYFLNKYHASFAERAQKIPALREMVGKMAIVTLFTNLTAAIGFGVFFFTKSIILSEFGLVAGLNIMGLFLISLILIPAIISFLKPPNARHTNYLESKWMNRLLDSFTTLVFHNRKWIYVGTLVVCALSVAGMLRLQAVGHIVDDLPQTDKIYTDLKFFEKNFKGVMPLEIMINTKKKYGALTSLSTWQKVDSFSNLLQSYDEIGGGLSLIKGVKFVKQGITGGGAEDYALPSSMEYSALRPQLIAAFRKGNTADKDGQLNQLLYSFIDSTGGVIRLSVNMADIGSKRLPVLLDHIKDQATQIFGKDDYDIIFTGTTITFLEGSRFIINSLRDSLLLAFAMILVCMIMLFRSWRIVVIALVTNIVPILITAGLMGWLGVALKPSTVLVFSVALGITVDVTIRFLVNFKQELSTHDEDIEMTVRRTIRDTGLSIIFTSLILVVGFGVFAVSDFVGTKSLGYLTALTLLLAMLFNLTLQPALLVWMAKAKNKKAIRKEGK